MKLEIKEKTFASHNVMKLSVREKIMLIVLGTVGLLALIYYFIYTPQMEKIKSLSEESTRLTLEVEKTKVELAFIGKLDQNIEELNQEIQLQTKRFYPVLLQDRLIVILDNLITKAQVQANNSGFGQITISQVQTVGKKKEQTYPIKQLVEQFNNPNMESEQNPPVNNEQQKPEQPKKPAEQEKQQFESMTVTMQIKGQYQQVIAFIKELEALNRTVVIKNLAMAGNDQSELAVGIQVDFYALPKLHQQDQEYLAWLFENEYGKDNPFVQ